MVQATTASMRNLAALIVLVVLDIWGDFALGLVTRILLLLALVCIYLFPISFVTSHRLRSFTMPFFTPKIDKNRGGNLEANKGTRNKVTTTLAGSVSFV